MFTGFIKCDCNGVCIEVNPFICTTTSSSTSTSTSTTSTSTSTTSTSTSTSTTSTSTSTTTTTTTTAACNRWQYEYLSYTCTTCEIIEYSSLYNSNPLTLDNFYQYGDIVITPYAYLGCDTGVSDASIPDTGVTTCEEINCFTTTTTTTRNLKVCKIVSMQALKVEGGSWSALDCLGVSVSGTIPFPGITDTPCIEFGTLLLEDAVQTGALDCGTPTTTTTTTCSNCIQGTTVDIDGQIWDKCNLNVTTYRNGESILQVQDDALWAGLTTGAWCHYGNNPANDAIYGKLYNWYAVNDSRGLAPVGKKIPTDAEWTNLTTFLGGLGVAGGKMKETGLCHWNSPNTGATNTSVFTGLPAGFRSTNGSFDDVGDSGRWWSSTQSGGSDAWGRSLFYNGVNMNRNFGDKKFGFSVRCIEE